MKRWTLKARLTLFYTTFLLLITCTTLGILFSMSGRKVLASVKNQLENSVQKSVEEIEIEDGRLEVDNDFYSVEKGIYLSLYDESGYFLYGKFRMESRMPMRLKMELCVRSKRISRNGICMMCCIGWKTGRMFM